jgi:hypothetical protein
MFVHILYNNYITIQIKKISMCCKKRYEPLIAKRLIIMRPIKGIFTDDLIFLLLYTYLFISKIYYNNNLNKIILSDIK